MGIRANAAALEFALPILLFHGWHCYCALHSNAIRIQEDFGRSLWWRLARCLRGERFGHSFDHHDYLDPQVPFWSVGGVWSGDDPQGVADIVYIYWCNYGSNTKKAKYKFEKC